MKGFEAVPLQWRRCPTCGYDLTGSISGQMTRCPECGSPFTPRSLIVHYNKKLRGRPISLSPHEWRLPGPFALLVILILLGFVVAVAVVGVILLQARI